MVKCLGGGIGRHARLKILWALCSCGFDSRPEYRKKNKKYFTKCLADQNKVLTFVKQTTGVRKCDGGLTPTQKEKSSLI